MREVLAERGFPLFGARLPRLRAQRRHARRLRRRRGRGARRRAGLLRRRRRRAVLRRRRRARGRTRPRRSRPARSSSTTRPRSGWTTDVPLVVADVNPHALAHHRGVVANPNCSTMQLMPVLRPIRDAVGLEHVTIATYQAVSGTGQHAIDGLRAETARAARRRRGGAGRLPAPDRVQRDPRGGLVRGRRRLHRRGAEARQRVAQDPRAARTCACRRPACACRS